MIASLLLTSALAGPPEQSPEMKEGWARVLVAAHPLLPGDVVRQTDVYAVQMDPAHLTIEQPPTPATVIGHEVVAPIFRNELIRQETLGGPLEDPQRVAPSRSYLLHLDTPAPTNPLAALAAGGCTIVAQVRVVRTEPTVIAVPPEGLVPLLTADSPTLVERGKLPVCP